ncbi:molybdopterin-dependent oxidoreductase [Desulfitobacterium sp. AusDCA]|uniref:molybdopterin-dependent oxidoreductase n=1 Tax=Desulfitobacterium sp. AusDCA TaxID=3240383 RepID=UPI003DA6DFC2
MDSKIKLYHNICTKDCFSSCSMISSVDAYGRLIKIEANPEQSYTKRFLCPRGYDYINYVYHPRRILHPWIQKPRFSGNWYKASWDNVLDIIARKLIQSRSEDGTCKSFAFIRGNGRRGILTMLLESMINSIGPITTINTVGHLCSAVRPDAQTLDFGHIVCSDPENMAYAKLVFLWGVNPAVTAIHQIPILKKVQENGGKIVLIDVFPSLSTHISDLYVQIKPGGDGALALLLIKNLFLKDKTNLFLQNAEISKEFVEYVITLEDSELEEASGVTPNAVKQLLELIDRHKPLAIWPGGGLLRYSNSGQNLRAIHALSAISGSLGILGGGIFASRSKQGWKYNNNFTKASKIHSEFNRNIYIDSLGRNILNANNPSVKFLWINGVNPLVSISDPLATNEVFRKAELIVTTEHFFTHTALASDIVLPGTTLFEAWDIVDSFFHYWIGVNQKAINPIGECRSDVSIASALCKKLNEIEPGISSFPSESDELDWIKNEIPAKMYEQLGIDTFEDLVLKPRKLNLPYKAEEFKLFSDKAKSEYPEIPVYIKGKEANLHFPFQLIFTRKVKFHNTQVLPNLNDNTNNVCYINSEVAMKKKIDDGDQIFIYNDKSSLTFLARLKDWVPEDVLMVQTFYDNNQKSINQLTTIQKTDMGSMTFGSSGIAFHDTFVNVVKL